MTQVDTASILSKAFSESTFVLVSSLVSFGAGVYTKYIHSKVTADSDVVKKLTDENAALKEMLDDPRRYLKEHALATQVGELTARLDNLEQKHA